MTLHDGIIMSYLVSFSHLLKFPICVYIHIWTYRSLSTHICIWACRSIPTNISTITYKSLPTKISTITYTILPSQILQEPTGFYLPIFCKNLWESIYHNLYRNLLEKTACLYIYKNVSTQNLQDPMVSMLYY